MTMHTWCVDERHGTPCPDPDDDACADTCDPSARIDAPDQASAARAAGWSEEHIASVAHLFIDASR